MSFFSRNNKQSRVFGLQADGRYGDVRSGRDTYEFEEAVGDYSRADAVFGRPFLGSTIPLRRFRFGFAVVAILLCLLIGRAAQLQVVEGEHYRTLAEGNRVRTHSLTPVRGMIFDRNGIPLVENLPLFVLTMTVSDLPRQEDGRQEVLNRIAELVDLQPTDLDLLITAQAGSPNEPVAVKKNINHETAIRLSIETEQLPGFHLETVSTRLYNTNALSLSHILGYTGNISPDELKSITSGPPYRSVDDVGKTGIERSAEALLRGTPGRTVVEVDSRGREWSVVERIKPTPGADVKLSIDLEFQTFVEQRTQEVMKSIGAKQASVVAIDPQSGSIRALVSLPSYDSNAFARGIGTVAYQTLADDPSQPLFPRAIAGEYPSGSIFKPFVAYAALAEGIISARTTFISTGGLSIGPWFFPDWRAGGHGATDVYRALSESVNTFFYIIGGGYESTTGLGVERITDYARRFGFGEATGVDLPGEADGFLPSKEWKEETKGERWYVGDTYHLAIGQGDLLVTPLQMAAATAVLANNGERVQPHLIEPGTPPALETTFDHALITIVRQGMRQAVTSGSARLMASLSEPVAGKTGTAQTPGNRPTHAWFTGFGPYNDPTLVIVVLIEEGGEGSVVAVPLAYDLFDWWFRNGGE